MAAAAFLDRFSLSLLDHPTIIHVKERLRDPTQAAKLHTVHVFDFDQTLFRSPMPNPALWDSSFIGQLVSWNVCGPGWWLNPDTLDLGPEAETSGWDGWWNEDLVAKVQESARDPECLTILLTGRNRHVYGKQLLRIVSSKGLDFDIIATKPGAVAYMENRSSGNTTQTNRSNEAYLMIHTFSVKLDLLYNVLLDYPTIRHMQVWDDRIGQIAKFKQAGNEWLMEGMLESFVVTQVNIPLKYMDPDREINLVMAMVVAHNRQVQLESRGRPLLVAGVGPMPCSRPETRDRRIWEPFVTYTPKRRARIDIMPIIQHTGIVFSKGVQSFLRGIARSKLQEDYGIKPPLVLRNQDLDQWDIPDNFDIALCMGTASPNFLETIGGLGATVLVEIEAVGELEGKIWGLKVAGIDSLADLENATIIASKAETDSLQAMSDEARNSFGFGPQGRLGRVMLRKAGVPHIVMAYNRFQDMRPYKGAKIRQWESLDKPCGASRIVLIGTIGVKRLFGMRPQNLGHHAVVPRDDVNIVDIIKRCAAKKEVTLPGKELGLKVKRVRQQMSHLGIQNKFANKEKITALVQALFDNAA
ncbi:hypothetical protein BGX31_004123 [Mortierella sp. GBA43]|nr:hypothetical protein BGX31_004123 [Mortierella sp. GBA43]